MLGSFPVIGGASISQTMQFGHKLDCPHKNCKLNDKGICLLAWEQVNMYFQVCSRDSSKKCQVNNSQCSQVLQWQRNASWTGGNDLYNFLGSFNFGRDAVSGDFSGKMRSRALS